MICGNKGVRESSGTICNATGPPCTECGAVGRSECAMCNAVICQKHSAIALNPWTMTECGELCYECQMMWPHRYVTPEGARVRTPRAFEPGTGQCSQCGGEGLAWNYCTNCEDSGLIYEGKEGGLGTLGTWIGYAERAVVLASRVLGEQRVAAWARWLGLCVSAWLVFLVSMRAAIEEVMYEEDTLEAKRQARWLEKARTVETIRSLKPKGPRPQRNCGGISAKFLMILVVAICVRLSLGIPVRKQRLVGSGVEFDVGETPVESMSDYHSPRDLSLIHI